MESSPYEKYGKKYYEKNKQKELSRARKSYYEGEGRLKKKEQYRSSRRNTILKSRYGITESDYYTMFSKQEGKCAICLVDYCLSKRSLDVDHNHSTGVVRGLLCNNCNRGLGHFQDSPLFLLNAYKYLTGKGGSCGV